MTPPATCHPLLQGIDKADYDIASLADEIRVDALCVELLRHLYRDLTLSGGMSPRQAGELCHGADYFLREFMIADRCANLFTTDAGHVRQFAGHWYIVRAAEPSPGELHSILQGTAAFFNFLARQGLLAADAAGQIAAQCSELAYYRQRIDDFWAIEGDGFDAWRQACPLPPVSNRP